MSCNSCPDAHTHHHEDLEAVALLKYMIDHNKHHADELYDIERPKSWSMPRSSITRPVPASWNRR